MRKVALLLDGGFVITKLTRKLKHFPSADDIVNECERIMKHPLLVGYDLLRIYFYHAPPATEDLINPIDKSSYKLGDSKTSRNSKRLLDALEMKPNFALRLGEAVPMGWRLGEQALHSLSSSVRAIQPKDLVPDIKQKGVDLRIGLDIARLSLRQLVDVVVVVTGDSDIVPAFKFARREGLKVFLDFLGHGVRRELKAHADIVF
jgi:uncharacterized LabA/DUF88 family protein